MDHPGLAGQTLLHYRVTEKIGEGGMGDVWTAQQTEPVKRVVALKLIKAGMDSRAVAQGRVPRAISLHFTGNATFDIGADTDSPVSLDYYDQAPFKFNGTIGKTSIVHTKK